MASLQALGKLPWLKNLGELKAEDAAAELNNLVSSIMLERKQLVENIDQCIASLQENLNNCRSLSAELQELFLEAGAALKELRGRPLTLQESDARAQREFDAARK